MVRFKSRYFLCEYIMEDQEREITSDQLYREIKESILYNFGDLGLAKVSFSLKIIYINSISRICILRVARDHKDIVWNSILFLHQIDQQQVKIRIIGCSGTIKKCEMKARRLLTIWTHKILKNELPQKLKDTIIQSYRTTQNILPQLNQ